MQDNKISSKIGKLLKSACAAAALPVFVIYVMIGKPDYTIMNGLAHVVLPVANAVGDIISWPVRTVIGTVRNIHDLSVLSNENESLRAELDALRARANECSIAIDENTKLTNELNVVRAQPMNVVIADIIMDNGAYHHSTILINRGVRDGIDRAMVVVSMNGQLVGIVTDVADNFARVRTLRDTNTNIAVRVAGTDVYGFLSGNGAARPSVGLFSEPSFRPQPRATLITSNISGVIPSGIYVGEMINDRDVDVMSPSKISRVMVLQFNNDDKYK